MKINICHIISGDLWGGAEAMAYHLIKGLSTSKDCTVSAILLNDGKLANELRVLNIPVSILNENKMSAGSIAFNLARIIKKRDVKLIHSHRYKENILALCAKLVMPNIGLISTLHGMPEIFGKADNQKYRLIMAINYFCLSRYFTKIICVSKEMRSKILRLTKIKQNKLLTIHNGIEINSINHDFSEKKNDEYCIGSAGRIFSVKDFPLMVDIANIFFKEYNNAKFLIAGNGPEIHDIKKRIKKYSIDKSFLLLGHVENIKNFYRMLNVYINTSKHEGIPISVLEAMANGVPVIAPKTGGLVEIVRNGVDGFLIEGRNPEDYAMKCLELVINQDLLRAMGIAARQRVSEKFSQQAMTDNYLKLYERVLIEMHNA
jgi:glycosyltransferase involved in cell wall biosynthesis